jgi:hypothetical protein
MLLPFGYFTFLAVLRLVDWKSASQFTRGLEPALLGSKH